MKRIFCILTAVLLVFSFTSCTADKKLDYTLLSEKLAEINPDYAFDFFDMIYYGNAYHVFLDLVKKDDVILSMTDNDGVVSSVTLTGSSNNLKDEKSFNEYLNLVKNLIITYAFTNEKNADYVIERLNLNNTSDYFKEQQHEFIFDRYKCTFTSNNLFITFCCEYFEEEEISSIKQ